MAKVARLRQNKKKLREWLESAQWQEHAKNIASMDGREVSGPLLSFLLLGGAMTYKAAHALGLSLACLAEESPEAARNILRRFMWHMNEESGNIGWGIPEAFAETLVYSERMAKEFSPILLSYIMDTGHDDNFCDHAILRRSCFFAVARFAAARPQLCIKSIAWLMRGLQDEDVLCRGLAAYALAQFPVEMVPSLELFPLLRRLAQSPKHELAMEYEIFDGEKIYSLTVEGMVHKLQRIGFVEAVK